MDAVITMVTESYEWATGITADVYSFNASFCHFGDEVTRQFMSKILMSGQKICHHHDYLVFFLFLPRGIKLKHSIQFCIQTHIHIKLHTLLTKYEEFKNIKCIKKKQAKNTELFRFWFNWIYFNINVFVQFPSKNKFYLGMNICFHKANDFNRAMVELSLIKQWILILITNWRQLFCLKKIQEKDLRGKSNLMNF